MARALRIQYPGAYYHVSCRGNQREDIFRDEEDREIFLEKLSLSRDIFNISILSYVLMNNHFHFLLTTPDGNLSEFMRHFNIVYTSAFNRRHSRVGHLYQGRYKSFLVEADSYLLELSRYIHLNAVRVKARKKKSAKGKWNALLTYPWSSLGGYLDLRKRNPLVSYEMVLSYVGGDNKAGREEYGKFVKKGLAGDAENPLETGKGTGIVGSGDFVQRVKEKYLKKPKGAREQPELRELQKVFEPEELLDTFSSMTDIPREKLCRRGRNSDERAMLMELLYRFCMTTQPQIGALVGGVDYSAVSQARSRLKKKFEKNQRLKDRFEEISRRLVDLSRIKI